MKFVTYQYGNKISAGLIRGQYVYDLAQSYFVQFRRPYKWHDLREYLESGAYAKLGDVDFNAMHEDRKVCMPLKDARLRAPILRPPKIVCVGLNYRDHAIEQKKDPPTAPLLFAKASNAVIGDGDDIVIPAAISQKVDPEVELGVVIGTAGYQIKRNDSLKHVFGYTIFNDVSARDIQHADKQWFRGKSCATFAPMGPVVVTADEIKHADAAIELRVNGETRQKGTTKDMVFDVPALIEYMSACFELEVGDVIATGTPAGVGVFRDPPIFLKSGDRVSLSIAGIGTLTNPVR